MNGMSLCLWKRPKYSREVIESLRRQKSIGQYWLFIGIDGDYPDEVIAMARKIDFCKTTILAHNQHVGCNNNTRFTLATAFEYFDYVVHLEDDTPLGPDALTYFEWARNFGNDERIFTVSAWRHPNGWQPETGKPCPPDENSKVSLGNFYTCWSWATWRNRWFEMRHGWTQSDDHTLSWCRSVSTIRGDRWEMQPMISRANNIGEEMGNHRGACYLPYWAGSKEFKVPDKYVPDWK